MNDNQRKTVYYYFNRVDFFPLFKTLPKPSEPASSSISHPKPKIAKVSALSHSVNFQIGTVSLINDCRYFKGTMDDPKVIYQKRLCQGEDYTNNGDCESKWSTMRLKVK